MGKEVKIGLGFIFILLVVLGVVLAQRLSGSSENISAAEAEDTAKTPSKGATDSKAAGKAQRSVAHKVLARPTIVEAKTGRSAASSPPSLGKGGAWSVVSDSSRSRPSSTPGTARATPPSYMPKAPTPKSAGYASPNALQSPARVAASDAPGVARSQAAASPAPVAGAYRSGYRQGSTSSPRYMPNSQLVNPARPTAPGSAGNRAAPNDPNPLRGSHGTATPDRSTSVPRYAPSGYQRTSQRFTQTGVALQPASPAQGSYQAAPAPKMLTAPSAPTQAGTLIGQQTQQFRPEPVARRADGTYVIQPHDSYWIISQRLYGSGSYFKALAEHNREKHPEVDKLDVGAVILAPTREELEQTYADLCPTRSHAATAQRHAMAVSTPAGYATGRTYEVQEGDTLYDIAKWELGKTARWTEIYDLNRDLLGDDHDHLSPGLKLRLPGGQPAEVITQRQGPTIQR